MTDETCKGCGAIVELDELRRDQLLECGECVTASNKLRRQLTAARKRIAELEETLSHSIDLHQGYHDVEEFYQDEVEDDDK